MDIKKKKARDRLIVIGGFQRWFVTTSVAFTGLFLLIFAATLYLWQRLILFELQQLSEFFTPSLLDMIEKSAQRGVAIIGACILAITVLATYQALMFSRRIAGPLFALIKHLKRCKESGELSHFKLRESDLFKDVETSFNDLVDTLKEKNK